MLRVILLSFFLLLPQSLWAALPAGEQDAAKNSWEIILWFLSAEFLVNMAINIVLVVIVIALTFIVSKFIQSKLFHYLEAANIGDEASKEEIIGVISRTMNIFVLITWFSISLWILWVDLGIFMGWIWFGIWFTLRTFLTNFISGIIIVSQGSYHIGDLIEIWSQRWRITKIQALFTEIEELDGTIFNIPNVRFFEENVRNFHTNDKRRIDVEVVVWYETDILQAKKVLGKVVSNFPMVLSAPASDVIIWKLWDNWVELTLRFWVSSKENYITLKSNVTETVNLAFKQTNIHIPYPQMTLSWQLDNNK